METQTVKMLANKRSTAINPPSALSSRRGFSLVEILVVIALVGIMVTLATPALSALTRSSGVKNASVELLTLLQKARAFAISHNTYVYVGVLEGDSVDSTKQPGNGYGRLYIALAASKDGTREGFTQTDGLTLISKIIPLDGVNLTDFSNPPGSGGMARPQVSANWRVANSAFTAQDTGVWKLAKGGMTYNFNKVIQFDPQGVASPQTSDQASTIVTRMEIGLQQAKGNAAPGAPGNENQGNYAAIQIDGLTGSPQLFRPRP